MNAVDAELDLVRRARESARALPLYARVVLVDAERIAERLERLRARGTVPHVPNVWQIFLGVVRMWHRMVFRPDTVGTSSDPVRRTPRARLLAFRPLRFPFLVYERAIAPLDFSGLLSSRERVLSHLLGAHHDQRQFAYDLEMLAAEGGTGPGSALAELVELAEAVASHDTPRARWLQDLVVYEGYHARLVEAARAALAGDDGLSDAERADPDISFFGYLAWCAAQPDTPEASWRAWRDGRLHLGAVEAAS